MRVPRLCATELNARTESKRMSGLRLDSRTRSACRAWVLAGGGVPAGFTGVQDAQDNYAFLYPFGWQEVRVDASCTCIVHNVEMRQAACSACIMVMQRAVS